MSSFIHFWHTFGDNPKKNCLTNPPHRFICMKTTCHSWKKRHTSKHVNGASCHDGLAAFYAHEIGGFNSEKYDSQVANWVFPILSIIPWIINDEHKFSDWLAFYAHQIGGSEKEICVPNHQPVRDRSTLSIRFSILLASTKWPDIPPRQTSLVIIRKLFNDQRLYSIIWGFHKWEYPNSWMVYNGKSDSNGWWLGVPLWKPSYPSQSSFFFIIPSDSPWNIWYIFHT